MTPDVLAYYAPNFEKVEWDILLSFVSPVRHAYLVIRISH